MTLLLLIIIAILIYYTFIYRHDFRTINKRCPNCGNPVEANFNVCPVCKETLRTKCHSCGNPVDITWKYCPYCEETLRKGDGW